MKKTVICIAVCLINSIFLHSENDESWLTTKTEHFLFVYQGKDSDAARELVSFCEEVYERVTGYFHSYPKEVRCVIAGNTDIANAASMSMPLSIVLNVASPSEPWLGARTGNWLESVLYHELTHYVHLNDTRGPFAFVSALLGDELKASHIAFIYEGWMIEGITTNLETLFTEGGRGRNPFFEMYYKAMILEDSLMSAEQANYGSSFPPRGRIYVAGYMIVHYLMETYGMDVFSRIHEEYIAFPFLGPERAIISQTGKSTREIVADMKVYYNKLFASSRAIAGGERISTAGFGNYFGPVITKRGLLVFRHTFDKRPALVFFDPKTFGEEIAVETDLHDDSSFTADESGDTIVFSSDTYDFRGAIERVNADLFVCDSASKSVSRLTRGAHLYHPVLSSDGTRLFAVERAGSYSRLVEVDRATGETRIVYASGQTNVYNPALSPDGKLIAFARNISGMQDIYLIRADVDTTDNDGTAQSANEEKAVTLFTNDIAGDYYPSFAGNDTVLFSSDREGDLRLYSYSIAEKKLVRIARDPVAVISGNIADGDLVYASYSSNGYCLKRLRGEELDDTAISAQHEIPKQPTRFAEPGTVSGYTDLPAPLFWFPYPSLGYSTLANPDIGFGLYTIGRSLLRESWWDLDISFYPRFLQPRIKFRASRAFDSFSLTGMFTHDYFFGDPDVPGNYQMSAFAIELGLPFVSEYELAVSRSVILDTGLYYRYQVESDSAFPFAGAGYTRELTGRNLLVAYTDLNLFSATSGSAMDLFAPWMIGANFAAETIVPVFEDWGYGFDCSIAAEANVPSIVSHQVVSPGISAIYASGAFAIEEGAVGISTKLDYLVPIALLDVPLLFGGSLLDMSGKLYWNYDFTYSPVSNILSPGRVMWVGLELRFTIGYGAYYTFPLLAGIRVSFDPFLREPWSAMSNINAYLNIALDGLFAKKEVSRSWAMRL